MGDALTRWNGSVTDDAERGLLACCASPVWARAVAAGRPYPELTAVLTAGAAAIADLPWVEIEKALQAHPRIGQRLGGPGREAAWSRREQAGALRAGTGEPRRGEPGSDEEISTAAALVEANRAYEERFGHVFLIFASGKTAEEMLAAARQRLGNDDATERDVVRGELTKIARLRLQRLFE